MVSHELKAIYNLSNLFVRQKVDGNNDSKGKMEGEREACLPFVRLINCRISKVGCYI